MSLSSARAPRRGFVWALVASVLLHAMTLGWVQREVGRNAPVLEPASRSVIAVRLLPPSAAPVTARAVPSPATPPPATTAAPRPPASRPAPAPVLAAPATIKPVASAALPTESPPASPRPVPESDPSAGISDAASVVGDTGNRSPASSGPEGPGLTGALPDDPIAAPEPTRSAPQADAVPAAPGSIHFPRSGRLEYAVTVGDPPTPIGRAVYAWEASDTAYQLSLSAETSGLVGLFRRVRIVQLSEGSITPDGLRPESFRMDRGPKGRNEFARFDWSTRRLTYGYTDAVQSGNLVEGTQDVLSLILQFAFVPIVEGRRDVALTTGRKLYVQTYERFTEEVIETPYGAWRAWHLRRVRAAPGDEGYDIWLATEQPFLPVRIRWTDRRGRVASATLDTVRFARD